MATGKVFDYVKEEHPLQSLTRIVWAYYSQDPLKRQGKVTMADKRDTTKYEVYDGNRLVYVGITNDIERRTKEHEAEGMDFTRVKKVGNATTKKAAGDWEEERIQTYKENHNGQRPKYNENDSGK